MARAPPEDVHINNFAFGMQMHMAGCTCGDPLQLMKIIHHAQNDITKRMTCIMKNGRLQNDLSAD